MKKNFLFLKVTLLALLFIGQAACSSDDGPSLNVSTSELEFPVAARSLTVSVSANCAWSATGPEWITCSPASGEGSATLTVSAKENTGVERTGTVRIAGDGVSQTISVKQEGVDFSISQYTFEFDGDCTPITATIASKFDWEIEVPEQASWLNIKPLRGSAGETPVTLTPAPFTDRTPRTTQLLTVRYSNTFSMVTVSQEMPNEAPAAPVLVSPADGSTEVKINAEFQWQEAVDPDGDQLTYTLMVSADGGTTWDSVQTEATTGRASTMLQKSTTYIWKVQASDPFGGRSESATATFSTGAGGAYADGEITRWQTETAGAPMPVQLVIMGDGYVEDDYVEGGTFDQDAQTAIDAFFSVEPYPTYRNYFRISTLAVYSQERGATVLNDMSGCKAQKRNTAFSATLEGGNSTGTSCDYDKVLAYAKKVPGVTDEVLANTTVILMINLDVYAGTCLMYMSGPSVSMCPTGRNSFRNVVSHEAGGHGFGRLLDEYRYYNQKLPADRVNQINYWRTTDPYYGNNISLTGDRNAVHWKDYFTRTGYEAVGLYEGACLYNMGAWRPERISCMEDNRSYYNAPSREAIVRRICKASGTTFSMDSFLANDKVKSDNSAGTRAPEFFVPLAPPILIDK